MPAPTQSMAHHTQILTAGFRLLKQMPHLAIPGMVRLRIPTTHTHPATDSVGVFQSDCPSGRRRARTNLGIVHMAEQDKKVRAVSIIAEDVW